MISGKVEEDENNRDDVELDSGVDERGSEIKIRKLEDKVEMLAAESKQSHNKIQHLTNEVKQSRHKMKRLENSNAILQKKDTLLQMKLSNHVIK